VLNAGDSSDRLNGHRGDDVLRGAAGNDTASFDGSLFGVTASLVDGAASGDGADALTDIENLSGSHLADSLKGDRFRNQLRGGRGADELAGGFGNDREFGDGGNDVLDQGLARNGGDILSGGDGRRDVVDYSARSHRVRVTRDGSGNDGERREHDTVLRDIDRVRR
jgi:Ca2+-binding RTX toxin-like protein